MATFYVLPSGSDSTGNGSSLTPWQTLDYALTGSRVTAGDTIVLESGVTYSGRASSSATPIFSGSNVTINAAHAAGSGAPITILTENEAVFSLSSIISDAILKPANGFQYLFRKINIENPDSVGRSLYNSAVESAFLEFEDATINVGNAATSIARATGGGVAGGVTLRRCICEGTNSNGYLLSSSTSAAPIFRMEACVVKPGLKAAMYLVSTSTGGRVEAERSTFVDCPAFLLNAGAGWNMKNNLLVRSVTNTSAYIINSASPVTAYLASPENFVMEGNVFAGVLDISVGQLTRNSYAQIPVHRSNTYVQYQDVLFADETGGDYALQIGSLASRKGVEGSSVVVDMHGNAFGSNDVGAIANSFKAVAPAQITNRVAFVGDSIQRGLRGDDGYKCWQVFANLTGQTVVNPENETVSWSGHNTDSCRALTDYVGHYVAPKYVMLSIGINDLSPLKSNETADTMAAGIFEIIATYREKYGIKAFWTGITSDDGTPPDNTLIDSINAAVSALCEDAGYTPYGSSLDAMRELYPSGAWQSACYDVIATDLHPNNAGQRVIAEVADKIWTEEVKGIKYGFRVPFNSTMPPLSLAPDSPGALKEVQEWARPSVTKRDIDKVSP